MKLDPAFSGRLEGAAKVTGAAVYEGDVWPDRMLHAALVETPLARGRIVAIDTTSARECAGFVDVVARAEAEGLSPSPNTALIRSDEVHFAGQPVAMVVAESSRQARDAADRVRIEVAPLPTVTSLRDPSAQVYAPADCGARGPAANLRGDPDAALATASHIVSARYETAANNHHPMEPHVAVCWWDGDRAVVHTCTQAVFGTRAVVAHAFQMPRENVRVISRLLGGGFGCKGQLWFPWLLWTMVAARRTGRPVRLELTRGQMFTLVGRRSATIQDLTVAADEEGRLVAIDHRVLAQTSTHAEYTDSVASVSQYVYRCRNVRTEHRLAPTNEPHPIPMRGPGEAPGSFAFESALDELAERLALDPVELRLRNLADHDQVSGLPWSSNSLAQCLRQGADRFGWREEGRRGWDEGRFRVGQGVGVAFYPARRQPCAMRVRLGPDAVLVVECGTQDMGSGTFTTLGQMAAEALGLPISSIEVLIGDTLLPPGPISAGSQVTQSFAPAMVESVLNLKIAISALLADDPAFAALSPDEIIVTADGLVRRRDSNASHRLTDLLARVEAPYIEGAASAPGLPETPTATGMGFGAIFAEVEFDPIAATTRVRRIAGAFGAGRIVNPTLARSQFISGLVGGIGMALHEETLNDPRTARVVGPSLAEYLVPTQSDMPTFDILTIDEIDDYLPEGIKGVGMLGHVGSTAAIANAIRQASGLRVRHLPIRIEDLVGA